MRAFPLLALAAASLLVACGKSSPAPLGQASGSGGGGGVGGAGGDGTGDGGGPDASSGDFPVRDMYRPSVTRMVLEVAYASGAEPYTTGTLGNDPWAIFEANAAALFAGSGKTFEVPHTLDKMEALGDVSGDLFDGKAVLAIAAAHRTTPGSFDGGAGFYVVFLPGQYSEAGVAKPNVLGVTLGRTRVIALFKPVIAGASGGIDTSRYVEQTTLVHEFGHAVGLVDNGAALTSMHKDDAHGVHCANQQCIMYYANEGVESASSFVSRFLLDSNPVVFADDCLADVKAMIARGGT